MFSSYKKTGHVLLAVLLIVGSASVMAQNINTPNKKGPLGTEVNTLTGNLFISRSDIYLPARGIDLSIYYSYNSFNFDHNKGFGNGWSLSYDIRYSSDTANNKIIQWGDGRDDQYELLDGGGYKSPAGFYNSLTQYQPAKFLLTELDGRKYYFDNSTNRKITRMEERNGNFINFTYTDTLLTSLVNNAGQSITFSYNTSGLLTSVTDAVITPSRSWSYTYDGSGNLLKVTDPLGGTNKYTYLVNGPMKTMSDKNDNTIDIIYYPDFTTSEIIGCNKRISFTYDTTTKFTVVTDFVPTGSNQVTTYGYKAFNGLAWLSSLKSNCCGYNMTFEFDTNGNKTKETDANGNITTYTYDNRGNMVTKNDALNQTILYTYTTNYDNISSFTDAKGFVTTMAYNSTGNLVQLTAPGNLIYTASYGTNGDLLSSTDAKGNKYTYNYDAFGNPLTVTGPNNYNAQLGYDARGRLLAYTDARGNTSNLQFDILDRLKKITDPLNNIVRLTYDAEDNPITFQNENDEITRFSYDASNRLVNVSDYMNYTSNFTFDAMDNMITMQNSLGHTTSFKYDTRNKLSNATDALGNNTSFEYDPNGNIITTNLPNGQKYSYNYDKLNRVTTVADNVGTTGSFVYDKNDNIISVSNGKGVIMNVAYDSLNRIKQITDPLGNSSILTYDKNSNVVATTDRNGFVKTYTYDSINRVKTYTDNNSFVITFTYDTEGNIVAQKDQNNNITSFTYDALNRMITTTYPDAKYLQYTYDTKGNIIKKRLTDGTNIQFVYDSLKRVTSKTLPGGHVFSYAYDALNRVITASNNSGTIKITYDALNRVSSETFDSRTVTYNYDIAGRSQTTVYPDSTIITKNFDTRNRLTSITKNNTILVSYQYDNTNRLTAKTFGNGVSTNLQYDFANRLSNISTASGSLQNTSFTYNNERNKQTINRLNNPALSEQFTFDNGNRITNYKRGIIGGIPAMQNSYVYDAVGNRVSANLNGTATTYATNNLNQLTNSNNGSQLINYTYDSNGNLIFDGLFYKNYDGEGRLLKDSSSPVNVLTYQYDAFGRRVQKIFNGVPLKYTYAGLSQVEERNGSTNALQTRTIFRNFRTPVTNEKNGATFYYHQNELNSVEAITNGSGSLTESYRYDLFGKQTMYDNANNLITSSIAGNRFGFTGQEYDSATGSNRFYFRNYNPQTGTFNQRDLIGYSDGMGMYQYVHNNPSNGIDVFGLEDCPPNDEISMLNVTEKAISYENGFQGYAELALKLAIKIRNSKDLKEIGRLTKKYDKVYEVMQRMLDKSKFGIAESLATKGDAILGEISSIKNGANVKNITPSLKMLSKIGMGLNVADLGIKAFNFGGALERNLAGEGGGGELYNDPDLGMATGNLIQSGLSFTPFGAALNLADFTQQLITKKSMNEHLADAGEYAGKNSFKDMSSEQEQEMEDWYRKQGKIKKYMQIRREQIRREYLKNKTPNCPQNQNPNGTQKPTRYRYDPVTGKLEIIQSSDPNEILGPDGVLTKKWVSVNDRLPYTILYENSKSASAPAKYVQISTPVEPKQDPATFELGSFGFNNLTFAVPNNTASYYQRLDLRDSLGLYVDVIAGYDQLNKQAFWQFQSIDPVTLVSTRDPLKGFLLLQDSANSLYGHGFVNFSMKPLKTSITLDTIGARASIVFDGNDTIPTNIHSNTIDAVAPTSHINDPIGNNGDAFMLTWSGADDTGGSGIDYYTVYASGDEVNYSVLIPKINRTDTTVLLKSDSSYCFFVLATDKAGNKELLRPNEIICRTRVVVLPINWLYFNGKTVAKDNILEWATASEKNSKQFDVERSLNGSTFGRIGIIKAAGISSQSTNYLYKDYNIDKLKSETMYYRLKQINVDGSFTYSNVVRLNYKLNSNVRSIVYPNPTEGSVTLFISDNALFGSEAGVYDINGKLLEKIKINSVNQVVNLGKYLAATYLIKLSNGEVLKVIKH